ncbi:MAG: hypothetical protein K8I30_08900, partial [Anaerolineae bacterium]|nr:hypothetical protein [Anaerolineae bacterium]
VPLLVSAIGLFLYAAGSAAALSAVLHQIINLLAAVMSMLEVFMQGARDVLSNSQAPALLMALIPITGYWMLKFAQEQYERDAEGR